MRIAVRTKCQRKGVGRKLIEYMFKHYPAHLSLDVSTDNAKAMSFYNRVGLEVERLYLTEEEKIEFASFKTPLGFIYKQPAYLLNSNPEPCGKEEIK